MIQQIKGLFGLCFMLMLSSCGMQYSGIPWPSPRPLGQDILAHGITYESPSADSDSVDLEDPTGILTLHQALALALKRNPELRAYSSEVYARKAGELQAGLRPNPEMEIEIEEFGGTGALSGFDSAESSFVFSQTVELGAKRHKRTKVAELDTCLGVWDYEAKRLDVITETTIRFIDVLTAQKQLEISGDALKLTKQVLNVISGNVKAGKAVPLEEMKAKVEVSASRIDYERWQMKLQTAMRMLAASWGSTAVTFENVKSDLGMLDDIPSQDWFLKQISLNPDIARWETELSLRDAMVISEEASGVPDLGVSLGYQYFRESGDDALRLGISIPLPFFDRNQGGVARARYSHTKALAQKKAAEVRIHSNLSRLYLELISLQKEITTLQNDVLPVAKESFRVAFEGYRKGKFGYMEVLDAQRTLFEAKALYINVLAGYHKSVAGIKRLIGREIKIPEVITYHNKEENNGK